MKQFLSHGASDQVLTAWRSLKLDEGENIQRYLEKFWDLHLKAKVYKRINFSEQKQQFCAGLPEEWREYVNAQRPKTISEVIHHSMIASNIKFQQMDKGEKSKFVKEKPQEKGRQPQENTYNKYGKPKDKQVRIAMAVESYGRVALKEARRMWPFVLGFAVTGAIILKFSLSLTPEDAKNSPFVKAHHR
ncbi:hypothetical protein L7F22_032127 [Adiantum nelumboides]|nr:hypothetical protein [Adiantum nelumboides]